MSFTVELPLPPSLNGAYRNVEGKGRVKVESYRKWKWSAARWIQSEVNWKDRLGGPVYVTISLPLKMRGDADNRVKPILDALVDSKRIDDDKNVMGVSVEKCTNKPKIAVVSVSIHRWRQL